MAAPLLERQDASASGDEAEPPGTSADVIAGAEKFGRDNESDPVHDKKNQSNLRLAGSAGQVIGVPAVRVSARSKAFLEFFPGVTTSMWSDWRWQMRNRFSRLEDISRVLNLSADERSAISRFDGQVLPLAVTPYYASLLSREDSLQALRRSVVPVTAEFLRSDGEADDPLGEDAHTPVPGLVHRYPDRVLFLVSDVCSTYCRYCTRSRMVGKPGNHHGSESLWEQALDYIRKTPAIRDVLISGGDPLVLADEKLEWLLSSLRAIPHVELVRIGTKVPAVLPQRITRGLVKILKKYHPLWMSIHFTHFEEATPECAEACGRLSDAGIPLGSQTVLLRGINDKAETLRKLYHELLKMRVRPYYLYQCDPIPGSAHFRTPVQAGIDAIRGLRGHTTGYAIPHFVIDAPGGGGKIPLIPDYVQGREGSDLILTNYENKVYRYPDCLD